MYEISSGISRRRFMALGATASFASVGFLSGCSQEKGLNTNETLQEATVNNASEQAATEYGEKLYIVDTITTKPGDGKSFLDDYMQKYRPMAEDAGMTLVSTTIAPPMWLDRDSNIVQVIWSLDDIAIAAWSMSSITRYNPEYVEWCAEVRKRVVSRDRSYFANEDYMEVLNNV